MEHMYVDIDDILADFFLKEKYPIKSPKLKFMPLVKLHQADIDNILVRNIKISQGRDYLFKYCSRKDKFILEVHCLARIIEQPKIKKNRLRGAKIRRAKSREIAYFLGMSELAYRKALSRAKRKVIRALELS